MANCALRTVAYADDVADGVRVTMQGCNHVRFIAGKTSAHFPHGERIRCTIAPCYEPDRDPTKKNWREL